MVKLAPALKSPISLRNLKLSKSEAFLSIPLKNEPRVKHLSSLEVRRLCFWYLHN